MDISQQILSDITVFSKYSKYIPKLKRRETWEEVVTRNMNMHKKKYPKLKGEIDENYKLVFEKKVLPSMRGLQFGGKPIEISPARGLNCAFCHVNHPDAFSEVMFLLLSGCGVGYSVQSHHIEQLPPILKPIKTRRYLIGDSIEGWSDAVKVLVKSYIGSRSSLPLFDFSDIRAKGERLKTSGGIAPGPEPLKTCLHHIQSIFDRKDNGDKLSTIEAHDIMCFIADAVLSGGIRRSAMISLFSFRDQDMLTCKFGNWYEQNPQRSRANNSAVILRHKIKEEEFLNLWDKVKQGGMGEPGFFFTNDQEMGLNPCAEISLKNAGFCNLSTFNVSDIHTQEELNKRAKAAAFIGTLQAGYTDFHYLRDIWKETAEKESLIGVSMTGIASNGILQLDLKESANIVKKENERVANLIGINLAARCTTVKPEGTSSLVVGSSSGIHAWHSKNYIRRLRLNKEEPIYKYLYSVIPELVEDEYFKPHLEAVVSIPQKSPNGAITKDETALQLLARVKKVYLNWVKEGHRKGHNTNNVSTTISIKENEWERVGNWMWENKNNYTALSVFPHDAGKYKQAPFEEIDEEQYNKMLKSLKIIDLTKVSETKDRTSQIESVACGGGSCEIV